MSSAVQSAVSLEQQQHSNNSMIGNSCKFISVHGQEKHANIFFFSSPGHPTETVPLEQLEEQLFSFDHHDLLIQDHSGGGGGCSNLHHHHHQHNQQQQYKTLSPTYFHSSSSASSVTSADTCQSPERHRFLSGEQQQQPPKMMMMQQQHTRVLTEMSSLEQLSSSGESGYFDAPSFTDLQAIFEADDERLQQHQQLTPAATPEEEEEVRQLEWTYLEPVQQQRQQMSRVLLQNDEADLQLLSASIHHSAAVSNNWPDAVVIKTEDDESSFEQSYSIPVQLIKREEEQYFDNYELQQQQQQHQPSLKRSSSTSSNWGQPRLCQVCGETAGKHSYYGGQVCPSCRAFFRRSVQSKYSDVYTCSKSQSCAITLKTRKNCQFCRFRLCELAGMKRSWVLADGERTKGGSAAKAKRDMEKLPTEPLVPMDDNELGLIAEYVGKMDMVKNQTEDLNPNITSEIAEMVRNKSCQMSGESRRVLNNVLEQRARLYALNLSEFTSLSSQDQIALLEGNLGPQIKFRLSTFFRTEIRWRAQVDMMLGLGDVARLGEMLAGISLSEDQRLEYAQFFFWCNEEHLTLLKKISQWVEDETTFCLLNLIVLFSPDQLDLKDRAYVEERQLFFCTLLQRYLRSRHGRAEARTIFSQGINIISYCRELHARTTRRT